MLETSWLGFPDNSLIAGAESLARGAKGAVPAAALHRDLRRAFVRIAGSLSDEFDRAGQVGCAAQ